ncbi:unnamed protein product [Choristocarpus tenellus]
MSAKAIRECHGKRLVSKWLSEYGDYDIESRCVQIKADMLKIGNKDGFATIAQANPWLESIPLVVKPDQLIKRRGKAGLLAVNKNWAEVQEWISARMGKSQKASLRRIHSRVEVVTGILDTFIVEPFVPHEQSDEYYVCINSNREGEEFLFCHEGGVDVGDVDAKADKLQVPIGEAVTAEAVKTSLLQKVPAAHQEMLSGFLVALFNLYRDLNFVYMEINPIVVVGDRITPLDMAAKLDETAAFLCGNKWGEVDFPAPFGRPEFPEEAYIKKLDASTGASLKLTILNHSGRVWTMVAGGGASVVYADTISDYGYGMELANYGEYSGAPSEQMTYNYARTILGLMTRVKDPKGKVLIIGGGIANFTDVAATFTGIISALKQFAEELRDGNISIWVRRAGPNYQEGLRKMRETGEAIGVPIKVFGPETHITAVVPMALGIVDATGVPEFDAVQDQTPVVNKDTAAEAVVAEAAKQADAVKENGVAAVGAVTPGPTGCVVTLSEDPEVNSFRSGSPPPMSPVPIARASGQDTLTPAKRRAKSPGLAAAPLGGAVKQASSSGVAVRKRKTGEGRYGSPTYVSVDSGSILVLVLTDENSVCTCGR